MSEDNFDAVYGLLAKYMKSPSLRHLRDLHSLTQLTKEIIKQFDRSRSAWQKWDDQREALARMAGPCWVPSEDLRQFLNQLDGAPLTLTDVEQRIQAINLEPYAPYPNDDLQDGCLNLYAREKALGTEMPAILGALQNYVEHEEERLRLMHEARRRALAEEERVALEHRFHSGADCKWTPLEKSKALYCRINGRAYRLTPTPDKMWYLHRIEAVDDEGAMLGRYQRRGDASKALAQIAYQPEPRWS